MCNLQAARLPGEPRQPELLLAGGQTVSAAVRVDNKDRRPASGAFHSAQMIAGPCLQHDAVRGSRSLKLRWSFVQESLNPSASRRQFARLMVGTICREAPGPIGIGARPDLCQTSRPGPLPAALGGQPVLERIPLSERGLRTTRRVARPTLLTKGSGTFASKACPALCQQSRPGPLSQSSRGICCKPQGLPRGLNDS